MSHTHVKFTTNGKDWRELPDNSNTETYLHKLSYASLVHCEVDTGEWWELECGEQVAYGGLYQPYATQPQLKIQVSATDYFHTA